MADGPRIDQTKVGQFKKIRILKFDNKKIWFFGILCLGSKILFFEENGSSLGKSATCPHFFV